MDWLLFILDIMNFIRMNRQRKEVCPTGYMWVTNIKISQPSYVDIFMGITPEGLFQVTKDDLREKYGDVMIISPSYDNNGNELGDNVVSLYVPHPAIRRINRWLRNHNKMKGGNLPY